MSFWIGAAKAVGEISEENFTRREKEKDREFQTKRDSESFEREKQLLKYRSDLETRQNLLLSNLKKTRGGSSSDTEDYVAATSILAQRLEGTEGSEEFISILETHPNLSVLAIEKIEEIEKDKDISLTPQEILDYIILAPGTQGESKVISLMGEDYEIPGERTSGFVGTGEGAFDNLSSEDIDLAEQTFESTMIEQAQTRLEELSQGGTPQGEAAEEYTEIQKMLNGLKSSDDTTRILAERELVDRYGESVVGQFKTEMNENPYLKGIYRSPSYRRFFTDSDLTPTTEEVQTVPFRQKLKTVADNWSSIPETRRNQLLKEYPELKDFLND